MKTSVYFGALWVIDIRIVREPDPISGIVDVDAELPEDSSSLTRPFGKPRHYMMCVPANSWFQVTN